MLRNLLRRRPLSGQEDHVDTYDHVTYVQHDTNTHETMIVKNEEEYFYRKDIKNVECYGALCATLTETSKKGVLAFWNFNNAKCQVRNGELRCDEEG